MCAIFLACLLLGRSAIAAGVACDVPQGAGGPTETYEPGPFNGRPAAAHLTVGSPACADPSAVSPTSQAPFWLGLATSAYQIEGAAAEGGRGRSIWDTFAATPGKVAGGGTGAAAADFYHRYLEDIQLMRSLGVRHFRMSLAWPRLLPSGTGELNQAGVDFYNRVIDALLANCIQPHITLYHWDLPQALEDAYGGWLGQQIVRDFAQYAEVAFRLFGDRVKQWSTINEPATLCNNGYRSGSMAPGRCSDRSRCAAGDSVKEPELCAYHTLLAHAEAVPIFRRLVSGGQITLNANLAPFFVPLTSSQQDADATEHLNRWTSGQFLDPLYSGDWSPERLSALPPDVLPRFTPEQMAALRAAKPDVLALNYYNGAYGFLDPVSKQPNSTTTSAAGVPLRQGDSDWLHILPAAFRAMLVWVDRRYSHPIIVITENGVDVPGESSLAMPEALCDRFRIDYFSQHLGNATLAVKEDGVSLQGYFGWSLMDNFEWADGYSKRFGVVHVDFSSQQRSYKASSLWLARHFGLSEARSAQEAMQRGEQAMQEAEAAAAG